MADSLFTRFTAERCPEWLCPECLNASLILLPDSFSEGPSAGTVRYRHEIWFDAEHYEYIFSCRLICERSSCKETVAISGVGGLDEVYGYDDRGNEERSCTAWFEAKTFFPPLPMFIPPAGCPDSVLDQLKEISSLLTGHPAAAANAIRSLLEVLLDELKVPRAELRNGAKQRLLNLHDRIEGYPHLFGGLNEGLMALKHLGNSGSHAGVPIKKQHLEDACLVVEQILAKLYFKHTDLSEKIANIHKEFSASSKVKPSSGKK